MCGIIGLLAKRPAVRQQLGAMMVPMLLGMTERGPDSAGLAVFSDAVPAGTTKLSVFAGNDAPRPFDWTQLASHLDQQHQIVVSVRANGQHAILNTVHDANEVAATIRAIAPGIHVLSMGRQIDLYKDTGTPAQVADRYAFNRLTGSHLIGHTRMATESAVTPDRAHPFTAGRDFCLVHNGSLSNSCSMRRMLEPHGIHFETDNDTEAACRFLEWRLREGDELEAALQHGFAALDGFYTFLMGTPDRMALIRDAFACKPAVVAETDDYVAVASEFRSLAHLPDIAHAHIFEPAPETMYVWKV